MKKMYLFAKEMTNGNLISRLPLLIAIVLSGLLVPFKGHGQSSTILAYEINGPYTAYNGPFFVKVHFNFVAFGSPHWIDNNTAKTRAIASLETLNKAFNPHNIYFLTGTAGCDNPIVNLLTLNPNSNYTTLHADLPAAQKDGIHIFIEDENVPSNFPGTAVSVPGPFMVLKSKDIDGTPHTQSTLVVHEMGHCLGLLHTFETIDCAGNSNENGVDCPSTAWECGDRVCDTPYDESDTEVQLNASCLPVNPAIPASLYLN